MPPARFCSSTPAGAYPHEARGLVTYCQVIGRPNLLRQRLVLLALRGLVSKRARQRRRLLREAIEEAGAQGIRAD